MGGIFDEIFALNSSQASWKTTIVERTNIKPGVRLSREKVKVVDLFSPEYFIWWISSVN